MLLAASNLQLIREFGLAMSVPKLPLHQLGSFNLPDTFLAWTRPGVLEENCLLVDNHLAWPPDAGGGSRTPRVQEAVASPWRSIRLTSSRGWTSSRSLPAKPTLARPSGCQACMNPETLLKPEQAAESDQPESVEAEKTWDAARLNFARELCEFLIWDPSLQGRPRFSADAMEMLEMVGRVLDKATRVKTIACDNATQHSLIKAMLLGLPTGLSQARILSLPFWKDIAYVPLPESCLPRCNFRKPVIQREVLFLLIGPAHLQKNVVGQLRSPKTIRYGRFFCDWSATLDLSMPPGAYQGYELQSDVEAASFLNAFHLVVDLRSSPDEIRIPWALTGALLLNLTVCLITGAVFHPGLSQSVRLENALTGYVLLDLGQMLADDSSKRGA
eukprot:s286_g10.t1